MKPIQRAHRDQTLGSSGPLKPSQTFPFFYLFFIFLLFAELDPISADRRLVCGYRICHIDYCLHQQIPSPGSASCSFSAAYTLINCSVFWQPAQALECLFEIYFADSDRFQASRLCFYSVFLFWAPSCSLVLWQKKKKKQKKKIQAVFTEWRVAGSQQKRSRWCSTWCLKGK